MPSPMLISCPFKDLRSVRDGSKGRIGRNTPVMSNNGACDGSDSLDVFITAWASVVQGIEPSSVE